MSDNKEEEFTKIVANALASDINSGSVSLLAQNIGGESKVELITPEKETPYISMGLGYARAWASVMDSLSLGGFSVVDQNQSDGVVLVDFNDTPVVADDDTLFGLISEFLTEDDDQELKTLEYKVKVIQGEKNIEVRITERNGTALDPLLAAKLLKVIRANLS
jgi:outer membrane protein assembly factor BamC